MNDLLMFYYASTLVSLAANLSANMASSTVARIKNKKNLKYKDLSSYNKMILSIERENAFRKNIRISSISIIPFINIPYTIKELNNINIKELIKDKYWKINVELLNKKEEEIRKKYLKFLKDNRDELNNISEDMKNKIYNDDYDSISSKKFKRVLSMNGYDKKKIRDIDEKMCQ